MIPNFLAYSFVPSLAKNSDIFRFCSLFFFPYVLYVLFSLTLRKCLFCCTGLQCLEKWFNLPHLTIFPHGGIYLLSCSKTTSVVFSIKVLLLTSQHLDVCIPRWVFPSRSFPYQPWCSALELTSWQSGAVSIGDAITNQKRHHPPRDSENAG